MDIHGVAALAEAIRANIGKVIFGKDAEIRLIINALISGVVGGKIAAKAAKKEAEEAKETKENPEETSSSDENKE